MPVFVTKNARCPFCRKRVSVYEKQCPACAAELALLSDLRLLPYALYNQGLDRYQAGDTFGALVKVSAAVELTKDFKEARQLLAHLATSLGLSPSVQAHPALRDGHDGTADPTAQDKIPLEVKKGG